jgi:hypothetical protein
VLGQLGRPFPLLTGCFQIPGRLGGAAQVAQGFGSEVVVGPWPAGGQGPGEQVPG